MNSSLYQKAQLKELASILGTTSHQLKEIASGIVGYYREWTEEKYDKTGELKRYKDGTIKTRVISPPQDPLYSIQSAIKDRILAKVVLADNIHGGVKGRSNITNAKPHQGNRFVFTTDLQDFFPNISHKQVNEALLQLGFTHHKAHWLTKLITLKYRVPQGAPTSSHIANIVFMPIDTALISLCNENGITYTRYVDDLTFSSPNNFDHLLNSFLSIIIGGGFKISYRKTTYSGNQTITGINVFNNYIDAPIQIRIKAQREAQSQDPQKPYSSYLQRIRKTNSIKKRPSGDN